MTTTAVSLNAAKSHWSFFLHVPHTGERLAVFFFSSRAHELYAMIFLHRETTRQSASPPVRRSKATHSPRHPGPPFKAQPSRGGNSQHHDHVRSWSHCGVDALEMTAVLDAEGWYIKYISYDCKFNRRFIPTCVNIPC
jgi:hypothetical protein